MENEDVLTEERNHIVENITEDPNTGRYMVSFRTLAAIYFLDKKLKNFSVCFKLLKRSFTEKLPVNFRFNVKGQMITHVELAKSLL